MCSKVTSSTLAKGKLEKLYGKEQNEKRSGNPYNFEESTQARKGTH